VISNEGSPEFPDAVSGVIDGAALDALALPAVADHEGLVTLKGWSGPRRASRSSRLLVRLGHRHRPVALEIGDRVR
jgi:hypothetical protein